MKSGARKPLLIVEGAELVGKSYLISRVYDRLERRYNSSPFFLNGCHWFNADVGIYGGKYGRLCIEQYVEMAEGMTEACIIFEKLHITDSVYHELYKNTKILYTDIENRLARLNARLILCTVAPDRELFERRLADRLALYPHYGRIAKTPHGYLEQLRAYECAVQRSALPCLTVDTSRLPDEEPINHIIQWIQHETSN